MITTHIKLIIVLKLGEEVGLKECEMVHEPPRDNLLMLGIIHFCFFKGFTWLVYVYLTIFYITSCLWFLLTLTVFNFFFFYVPTDC